VLAPNADTADATENGSLSAHSYRLDTDSVWMNSLRQVAAVAGNHHGGLVSSTVHADRFLDVSEQRERQSFSER
jgi:hypothetical protein